VTATSPRWRCRRLPNVKWFNVQRVCRCMCSQLVAICDRKHLGSAVTIVWFSRPHAVILCRTRTFGAGLLSAPDSVMMNTNKLDQARVIGGHRFSARRAAPASKQVVEHSCSDEVSMLYQANTAQPRAAGPAGGITMGYAKYVGRIGALAIALGVGAGLAATPWVASAEPNVSVSANGETRVDKGTADSSADGTGSVAIAHGDKTYQRHWVGLKQFARGRCTTHSTSTNSVGSMRARGSQRRPRTRCALRSL
jgi:hypothetical protein